MWPANFFSRFGPRAEKFVHRCFTLKMELDFRDWKIMGCEALSLVNICQSFGGNHLHGIHGRRCFSAGYDWTFISGSHLIFDSSATKHLDGVSTLCYRNSSCMYRTRIRVGR